jgi:hypothetical protein
MREGGKVLKGSEFAIIHSEILQASATLDDLLDGIRN